MDKSQKDEIKNLISFGDENDETPSDTTEEYEDFGNTFEEDFSVHDENTEPYEEAYEEETEEYEEVLEDEDLAAEDKSEEDEEAADEEENEVKIEIVRHSAQDDFNHAAEKKKSKPKPKSKRFKIIRTSAIFAVIAAMVIAFIVTDSGIIGAYKRNFAHNFSKIFGIEQKQKTDDTAQGENSEEADNSEEEFTGDLSVYLAPGEKVKTQIYGTEIKSSVIIPYDYASESEYSAYSKGIVCAATNYMCYINGDGVIEWECSTSVIDPILRTAGGYILIAQKNGTKLCLYNGSSLIYDIDCEDGILNADLSENGDCVLVTTKDLYKGAICAYNKSGKLIYARSSGDGSVIDAAISPKSRNIAATLLDTDEAIRSTIEIFDIMKDEPQVSVDFDNTILFDVEYFGNTLNVFGDNSIAGLKSDGSIIYDYRFEDANITHYSYDSKGNKLLLLDAANVPTLAIYNLNGKQKFSAEVPELSDYLNIRNSRIMYNIDREIITGRANGKKLLKYTASMDIRDLVAVSSDMFFIVYSNSIELVRM